LKKKDLLELIKSIEDDMDVDDSLKDSELAKKFGSLDVFKEKIKSDKEFKAYLDSEEDKHYSKALETWKTNNLQGLIDEEIKKRFPEKDPKDTELAKLKAEMEKMQKYYRNKIML
jgi:hypothetical protein